MLAINPPAELRAMRDYQAEGIELLRDSLRSGHRRPMVMAPTGAGKTLVAANLVRMALAKGKRVCFCIPALSLVDQTAEAFAAEGIWDVGIIQAQNVATDWSRPVQIASVQTLMRRWPNAPEADMVIVDEAHVLFEHYGKWMCNEAWLKVPFIGLSATPWTKGLGKLYDDLIILTTTRELIDQGYLSNFRVFAPGIKPDLKKVRLVAGDYHDGELSAAMDQAPLVADVVKTWLERAEGRPTLCFGVDRAHAKHLQQQFEAAGVPCGYQDMATDPLERRQIKNKFHNGEYKVVCNVDTLTVGVDWDVRAISLVRPTKSIMKFVQIIGRGLRTAPGKDEAGGLLILDHSDNHQRLGFVTDIVVDKLHDGRKQVSDEHPVILPKECPSCSYLRPPRVSVCPNCGFTPAPRKGPEHAEGQLIELRPQDKPKKRSKAMAWVDQKPKAELYGELQTYALEKGRKPGWSAHAYRELHGVWPNAHKDAPPRPVSYEVATWIRSRNIKWAKSHGR